MYKAISADRVGVLPAEERHLNTALAVYWLDTRMGKPTSATIKKEQTRERGERSHMLMCHNHERFPPHRAWSRTPQIVKLISSPFTLD